MVEPIAVTDRPGRKASIRLALDDVVLTEFCYGADEMGPDPHVHRLHADCCFDRYLQGLMGPAEEFDQHPPPEDGGLDQTSVIVRTAKTDAVTAGGVEIGFLAVAEDALGAIGLVEYTAPPGFPGPPPHLHEHTSDAYYVLEGRLDGRLGDDRFELGPGDVAMVPPGSVHGFSNALDTPTRFLDIHAPGGFEGSFRELAATGTRDQDVIVQTAARFDMILA